MHLTAEWRDYWLMSTSVVEYTVHTHTHVYSDCNRRVSASVKDRSSKPLQSTTAITTHPSHSSLHTASLSSISSSIVVIAALNSGPVYCPVSTRSPRNHRCQRLLVAVKPIIRWPRVYQCEKRKRSQEVRRKTNYWWLSTARLALFRILLWALAIRTQTFKTFRTLDVTDKLTGNVTNGIRQLLFSYLVIYDCDELPDNAAVNELCSNHKPNYSSI